VSLSSWSTAGKGKCSLNSKTISPQTGAAFLLKKGESLIVTDPKGQQVSDLFCFNADDPNEHLSSGRSIDYADTIYLTRGHILYSNRSSEMLRIEEDSCGQHDFLMTPCSLRMFQIVAQNQEWHPSCHENLAVNLKPFGINPDQVSTTFNIFMNVQVDPAGKIQIQTPLSKAGSFIVFEAKMNLIVGLTACSHEETNGGVCKEITFDVRAR